MSGLIRWWFCVLVAVFANGVVVASVSVALGVSPQIVRVGSAALLPRGAVVRTALPAAKELQLTVALKSRDPSGLESYATEVSTPSSSLYKHYLTVGQFAQSFGATPSAIAAVQGGLRAQGLSISPPLANHLTLQVSGSVARVEKALSVSLSQVELPSGHIAYANTQAPAIPANISQFVQGVIGLDNVTVDQSAQVPVAAQRGVQHRTGRSLDSFGAGTRSLSSSTSVWGSTHASGPVQLATGGPQPCAAAQKLQEFDEFTEGVGETADEIATAYGFSGLYQAGDFGDGQTIAVFEQEAFQASDIAAYQACYGTSATVTPINVDGGPEPYKGEDTEAALDIEQIIGLAPQAHVLVYQGPIEQNVAPVDIISMIVSDDTAKVISSSYGECEALTAPSVLNAENTLLQEAAAQGQSFFVASGDSGSEQCSRFEAANKSLAVQNPASQPFATGVGGTALYSVEESNKVFYTGALPPAESVWNEGPAKNSDSGAGTGGGISEKWEMPNYQSSAASALGVINSESSGAPCASGAFCREVPDISADADSLTGYVVFVNGGWFGGGWKVIGGTSASAPLWAAFTGLANSSAACHGNPIGFINPSLYSIASNDYAGNFRDVIEPSLATGDANNDTLFGKGPFSVSPGYDMTTGLGAPIGANLAASLCAMAIPVASPIAVSNPGSQTNVIQPVLKPLVIKPPTISHVSLSGISKRKPKLKFTISTAPTAPAFKTITVTLTHGLTFSSRKSLLKGLAVKAASGKRMKLTATVHHSLLTITLAQPVRMAQFTLSTPTIQSTRDLTASIKHHNVKHLSVSIKIADTSHTTTRLTLKPKAS